MKKYGEGKLTVIKNDPDHVYLNITIPHDDSVSVNGSPTKAKFFQVRTESILGNAKPEDYALSVVRFQVPTSLIPILIFPVQPNPGNPLDPNYSVFSVTLSYGGNDYQTHLNYVPQQQNITPPPAPIITDPVERSKYVDYYSVYSVQWMLDIINVALKDSFTALKTANPGVTSTEYPIFTYEASTTLISLYVPVTYEVDGIQIFVNSALSTALGSAFETKFYGYVGITNGKNMEFVVRSTDTNNVTLPTLGPCYKLTSEYNIIPLWLPMKGIVFTSTSIPVRQENLTASLGGSVTPKSDTVYPILTDFKLDISSGFEYKTYITYFPTAEYRRIDLYGNTPITNIDVQVYWIDNYQNIYPIMIPAHDEVSIKLLFERK